MAAEAPYLPGVILLGELNSERGCALGIWSSTHPQTQRMRTTEGGGDARFGTPERKPERGAENGRNRGRRKDQLNSQRNVESIYFGATFGITLGKILGINGLNTGN